MRHLQSVSLCLLSMLTCALSAQSTGKSSWDGVWQGELEGQPGVTLTLAEENGQLGGTVVFNMVSREDGTPHVIGSAVHLVHPRVDGKTLSFEVIRKSDSKQLAFAVLLIDSEKARLQCTNCGEASNSAVLVKSRP